MQLDVALAVEESLTTARAASLRDAPQAPDDQTEQRSSDRPVSAPPVVLTSDARSLTPSYDVASDELAAPEVDHTPAPDPPSSTRRAPTPRFSTVVNSRSRETLAVDASDEDNTAAVPTSDSYQDNTADTRTTQDLTSPSSLSPASSVDAQHTTDDSSDEFTSAATTNSRDDRTDPDHNNEPPFLTDGRGRVVWSSPCTGRSGQEAPSSRTNSSTKSTRP
ncbi:hypothetical protein EDD16DRAFT_457707 [Pisolithus croceorrhizus]|nr:hypothetical protein EDD16DRAFT_457707 [Pisolithus croceorrhizus]KAI6148990.1 hypothetical protein EDD17DRAFT_1220775 [Pisolithus thermaeus]